MEGCDLVFVECLVGVVGDFVWYGFCMYDLGVWLFMVGFGGFCYDLLLVCDWVVFCDEYNVCF